jgi:hypothetical protein
MLAKLLNAIMTPMDSQLADVPLILAMTITLAPLILVIQAPENVYMYINLLHNALNANPCMIVMLGQLL